VYSVYDKYKCFFINVNQNKFFVEKFMKRSGAAQNSEKLKARSSKLKVQRKKRALRIGKGEVVRRSGMDSHAIRRLCQAHNKLKAIIYLLQPLFG
jgi:hypothetical protein